jgi:chloride channel protein, CIC family
MAGQASQTTDSDSGLRERVLGAGAAAADNFSKMAGRRWFALRSDQFEYVWLILLAAAVGAFGALGNLGFRYLIDFLSRIFRGVEWRALGIPKGEFFLLLIPVVLCSGGLVLAALEYLFPGEITGYGFPNFLAMVNLGRARMKARWIFLKALGAALSLGAGASVGREGPIAQIGGSIGSVIAQAARLTSERTKILVACGAGAGIATTFNAPIGGLLFAQEIVLLGETELTNLTLLIIATTTSVVTSGAILGSAALFVVQPFELRSYWELITYVLMGLAIGAVSAGYIRFFHAVAGWFRRMNLPVLVKLAIGLTIVGLIAIPLPQNLSDGYPVINQALAGQLSVPRMAALGAAKIAASSISLGCGAPGGVFGPVFFIGSMLGGSFRWVAASFFPHLTGPRGSYALIGLGAFLAGTTHAPLTAVFLLFEMTREFQVTVPALLTSILALVVARAIERESIDTYALALEGKTLDIGKERLVLTQIPVSAVMTQDPVALSGTDDVTTILRVSGETSQSTIPVVDSDNRLLGIVVHRDLLELLASGKEVGPLINAYDLCRRNPPAVTSDSSLDEALQRMQAEGVEELPVVDAADHRVLGLVSRGAIGLALSRTAISLGALATRDTGIFWSRDYRIVRIPVPPAADGMTVRALDPRARFGVNILAVQRAANPAVGFAPIDPDKPLAQGDLIVVAGRPASVRSFEDFLIEVGQHPTG